MRVNDPVTNILHINDPVINSLLINYQLINILLINDLHGSRPLTSSTPGLLQDPNGSKPQRDPQGHILPPAPAGPQGDDSPPPVKGSGLTPKVLGQRGTGDPLPAGSPQCLLRAPHHEDASGSSPPPSAFGFYLPPIRLPCCSWERSRPSETSLL